MEDYIDVLVALGRRAHLSVVLDDDETEDLGVGQKGEDNEDDDDCVARAAESVLTEGKLDGDEAFEGHAQHQPAGTMRL